MAFLINPYDADLNLADKEDRKLFKDGCAGLKEADLFDGKKENYVNFTKLLENEIESVRLMECLIIPTEWVATGNVTARRVPILAKKIDIFHSNLCTKDQLNAYGDLVWSQANLGDTPRLFDIFETAPTSTAELEAVRNKRRLKHVMLGTKLWASLTSDFKIEIQGDQEEFKHGHEYDGPRLWDYIRRRVNPTTTVGASKLKDLIESAKLSDFGNDVVKFNTWFDDTKKSIIKEEGEGRYNEYLRSLFKTYLGCTNQEFVESIKDEKRKWTQGKLPPTYDHRDLLELGRVTFNNISQDEEGWKFGENGGEQGKVGGKLPDENNFLALATELISSLKDNQGQGNNLENKFGNGGKRSFLPWRFENPDGSKTKEVKGTLMRWCSNDCHPRPMWCGRKNCLNKADFAKRMQDSQNKGGKTNATQREKAEGGSNYKPSSEFKIALSAMCSEEDFKHLEEQFFSEN